MRKVIFLLLTICCTLGSHAQDSQTAYNFLRLPMSAHAAALGGDNISLIEDDAALMFNNPALLGSVSDKTIGLNFMTYMQGAVVAGASFNRTAGERASWGATAQYANYGKMKETDEYNTILGDFSAKDIALTGLFAYELTDHLVGGIAAKFITSYIGDYNSLAVGVDLGLNYYHPESDLSLSIVAHNLGGQVKAYHDDYERMPMDLTLGATKRLKGAPFRLSASLVDMTHYDYKFIHHLALGVDILLGPTIWVGGGYNFRRAKEMTVRNGDDEESSHGAGLSLGAGLQLERFKLNLAYAKYHVSSNSIVINLALNI
ncbi:MAG: type IX secretion system protein PorQ [Prevotella sp.]|nr:type IX secretion system protein PorQ [Prevotella sp.]